MIYLYRYAAQISVDLLSLARQATPKSPILLLYRKESEICEPMLANFASANQVYMFSSFMCRDPKYKQPFVFSNCLLSFDP